MLNLNAALQGSLVFIIYEIINNNNIALNI